LQHLLQASAYRQDGPKASCYSSLAIKAIQNGEDVPSVTEFLQKLVADPSGSVILQLGKDELSSKKERLKANIARWKLEMKASEAALALIQDK